MSNAQTILCINTGGVGDLHGLRMRRLTETLDAKCVHHDFDRSKSRWENAKETWKLLCSQPWDLVYMESTSIAGGLPLILAARTRSQRYVVSSGDPIGGFFRSLHGPLWGMPFEVYERMLYRHCAGFIGWTPYLAGAAMKRGAARAVTVEGAVETSIFSPRDEDERRALKERYGLDPDHLVCGVIGTLDWMPRHRYCYGLELVEMLPHLEREDVSILIVGDESGKGHGAKEDLEARIPAHLRSRAVFTGRVPENEVARTLGAMDIGFVTQVMDSLGRYRLTTKLPEYLASGLPVAMSPIAGYYDYAREASWALPGAHPASAAYHRQCARWIDALSWEEIQVRRQRAPAVAAKYFDYEVVRPRFETFIRDLLSVNERS